MNPALEVLLLALRTECPHLKPSLFLGAEPHPELLDCSGWQPQKPLTNACLAFGMSMVETPSGKHDCILFLPGKSKDEILAGYAQAHDLLTEKGILLVAIANTAGASRFEKELSRAAPIQFSVSKHKCRAFAVAKSAPLWNEAILQEWQKISQMRQLIDSHYWVCPGVFSADHIDPGSALLIQHLPKSLRGEIADVGAGWGYLSDQMFKKCAAVSKIDLYEADQRALACARLNVKGNADFFWHDVTCGIPSTYDHVVMNPPFHSGLSKDISLGQAFITRGIQALKRGGSLYLVANRQLPYENHILSLGKHPRILFENGVFKIILAS